MLLNVVMGATLFLVFLSSVIRWFLLLVFLSVVVEGMVSLRFFMSSLCRLCFGDTECHGFLNVDLIRWGWVGISVLSKEDFTLGCIECIHRVRVQAQPILNVCSKCAQYMCVSEF